MADNDVQVTFGADVGNLPDTAKAAADVMRSKLKQKPTRYGFAIEALDGIVEAAEALTLLDDPMAASEARSQIARPPHAGGAVCGAEVT